MVAYIRNNIRTISKFYFEKQSYLAKKQNNKISPNEKINKKKSNQPNELINKISPNKFLSNMVSEDMRYKILILKAL